MKNRYAKVKGTKRKDRYAVYRKKWENAVTELKLREQQGTLDAKNKKRLEMAIQRNFNGMNANLPNPYDDRSYGS